MTKKHLVLVSANVVDYNGSPGHILRHTYAGALTTLCDAVPVMLPSLGAEVSLDMIKDRIDGILLTGSPSNVAPACYGATQEFDDKDLDVLRDDTTLPLIRRAVELDIPLLAICRGFQELNVALGGTLHQRVQDIDGMLDHRPRDKASVHEVYRHQAHALAATTGGVLERWGAPAHFTVNTIHQQGIRDLAPALFAEAHAPDGLIEIVSIPDKKFIVGTQFHPEGDWDINPVSRMIFEKFGQSLRG